jgi:hypothetical protein
MGPGMDTEQKLGYWLFVYCIEYGKWGWFGITSHYAMDHDYLSFFFFFW